MAKCTLSQQSWEFLTQRRVSNDVISGTYSRLGAGRDGVRGMSRNQPSITPSSLVFDFSCPHTPYVAWDALLNLPYRVIFSMSSLPYCTGHRAKANIPLKCRPPNQPANQSIKSISRDLHLIRRRKILCRRTHL